MPVSFNQIATNTATVMIPVKNLGTVTIEYYPNKLTSKYVADLEAGNVDDNRLLQDLIKSWDIIDDTVDPPVMFPLERMDEFGYSFKVQVAMAIVQDIRPEAVAPQMNGAH